jgi:hypothetical protein
MAVVHGYNGQLYFMSPMFGDPSGTVNLTGRANDVTLSIDNPTADITGFGSAATSFLTGQYSWKLDAKGFCDAGTAGTLNPDGAFSTAIMGQSGTGGMGSILFLPEGTATGRPIWRGAVYVSTYSVNANLGGGVAWTASFQGSGTVTRTTGA